MKSDQETELDVRNFPHRFYVQIDLKQYLVNKYQYINSRLFQIISDCLKRLRL